MPTIETICTECQHSKLCKFNDRALKLSSRIENEFKIANDEPFFINLTCSYRKENVLNPRFATELK